jgi:hypothetical protein
MLREVSTDRATGPTVEPTRTYTPVDGSGGEITATVAGPGW